MSNATPHCPSAPASKAARSFSRFVRTSVKPVVFKLSRKLSVTYWPGRRRTISAVLLALLSGFVPGLAGAGPTGSQVVAGSATVLKPTSTTTQVNQASQNVVINWQSFSIGAGEAVRFVQPSASAVALNRVIGSDPSRIFGTLQANGKVFLVNNAGVYFAPGASVDVGGLVATSMNISNASFLSGKYKFEAGAQAGEVANYGQLRGAFVVLAAPQVTNAGSIVTTGGTTALAAGGRVSLDIAGDKLVTLSVDAATANAAVVNSGSVSADGGKVFMNANSANAVLDTVINTSGIVRAGSIGMRNGQIVLDGGAAGVVQVSGTLAASGAGTGAAGGAVKVLGDKVTLANGASIDVSGDTGGGSALVGGDFHGAGGARTAAFTQVDAGAVINADALVSGNGGKVAVWADQHTGFGGAISAKGGAQGGDGGFVETSGKATLAFAGKVDTTAAHGATGSLLLDPTDITIDTSASSGGMGLAGGTFGSAAATSTLNVGDLTTALGSTNVIVDTASGAAGTGHIVVATDINWNSANSLTLKADANITNNAQINGNGGGAIALRGDGVVSAGTLTSAGGDISIGGTAGGSSKAGSVIGGHIQSGGGNVSINAAGAVTTGDIHAGTGTIAVSSSNGGVAIDGAVYSNNPGTSAIVVTAGAASMAGSAGGGDITVSGSVIAGSGRATLYTGSIAGSIGAAPAAGIGSGRFRYNSAPGTDNFSAALGGGVNVVYREQPTLTITGNNASSTYGDADPTFGLTYVGLLNGDTAGQALTGSVTLVSGATLSGSGHTNAGTYAITVGGGTDTLGYSVAHADGTFNVAKKALTASVSAPNKVYDGNTAASPTLIITGGLVGTETLGVSGSGTFNAKDVLTANQVTVNTVALVDGLNGGAASNYDLATGITAAAAITPKALTASFGSASKAYDGSLVANAAMTVSGMVGTETVTGTGIGTYNSKDVLTANSVTVASVALADGANGGLGSNYSAAGGQSGTATITPKALTASVTAPDKVYDGSTTAAPVLAASGLVGTETLVATGTGAFNSKDVLTANQVTVQTVALADGANGGLATNYSLASGQTATAQITPKALTATAAASDKAYDGTLAATAAMAIDPAGFVGTETVTGTGAATFNTKDVLTASVVTVNAVTLADGANGGLGSNYSVGTGQTATAHITPKTLSATIISADKAYDGTTTATPTLGIAGLAGAEQLVVSTTSAFNSKDVLTANQVTVQSVALADGANGGVASNYDLAGGQTATAHITPKALTATVTATDKVYDGSVAAAATLSIASGLVGGETVTATGSGAFNSKDVLAANQVTVNSVALADGANGGLASNYDLGTGQTATAHITPKALTAIVANADKAYDGGTAATAAMNMAGLVGTEIVTGTGTGTFDSKDVVTASQVTVNAIVLADGANGGLASNYSTAAGQVASAHITPKSLTATATAANKVYDGSTAAATALSIASGLVGTETVTVSGSGSFNSKDVLNANQVTVQSVALADGANGGLASNYNLGTGQAAAAHITPKALSATVAAADKAYDGNTVASAVMNVAGLVGAETVSATGDGVFDSKDVLTASQVTVNAVTLADGANGGLASNYSVGAGQTATAHITPKALTVTLNASDKVYDGNTNASGSVDVASGLVGTETVDVGGSAVFNSKDVLTANLVTVTSLSLTDGANGGLASNYSAAPGQAATAHITPKALTATAAAADKAYDGGLAASAVMNIDAAGLVGSEMVSASGTGVFDSKDVLTASVVTVQSVALADGANGGLASNYSLGAGQTGSAHITPKALTATATAFDKIYDGNTAAAATLAIASGLVAGESVTATGTGMFNTKDVATANAVTVQSVALADGAGGGLASNYSLAVGQSAAAHITPKSLTATASASDKVYDGSLAAAAALSIDAGLAGAETVTASGTGVFNTKDVVTANQVTVDSVALVDGANGGLASNYSLGTGQTATAHITPKSLTATVAASDKAYDGNVAANAVMNIDGATLVGAETITGTGTGVFNSKDVLTANTVTVNAVTLADGAGGGMASNYSLGTGQAGTAHITPKALTATAAAADKTYDGSTVAAATVSIASGLVGSETVNASATGNFNSKDVLAANQVTVQSVALSDGVNGGLASNYSLGSGQTAAAHITPRALTATAAAPDKVYDGSVAAAPTVSIAGGLVGAEMVNASGTGTFNSKDVQAANLVTVQSVGLSDGAGGGLASNYSLAAGQTATAHITPKALTATAAASDKTYDGNTVAAATVSIASGLVGAETVSASGTGVFNSKDVLTANQVTVQSVALADGANGGLASNYDLATGQTASAHITPKSLTATAAAADKTYDGNTVAATTVSIASGLVGTETVSASGSGVFNSKDVVSANQVTVQSVVLADGANGGLASNYDLGAGQAATAHITPKSLTATVAASDKAYDGNVAANAVMNIDGATLVGAETITGTGTGVFNSKDVLTANTVTVNAVTLADGAGGGMASNYSLGTGQAGTAHITPKALTATAAAADKTYDGSTVAAATVSIASGLVGSETVNASATGNFNSKDVLAANQVTVQSVALSDGVNGGLASNYSLGSGQTAAAHITPRALTATAAAPDKVYDGSVAAAPTVSIAGGLVGAEMVNASGTGTFNSKDVQAANLVTVQSVGLSDGAGGGLASNYSLAAGQTATAHITPKSLTATAAASDKTYDGNTVAAATVSIASGLVGTETLIASGTGAFNSKDVLTANQVTVQSVGLVDGANGGLASNYSLGAGQTATAHITPKALTASAAAADKIYDGGVAGTAVMNIDAASLVGTETVTSTGTGVFDSKDVAAAGLVTVQSVLLANGANGGLASNYSLGTGQVGAAHITPKALTATATASDKTYDGNLAAATSLSIASGLVGAELVSASGSGVFNSKDVLAANQVTVNAVALADGANGGLASNYQLGTGQTATAHITPKALAATAAAPDKTYDGNLVAAPTVSIASGLVGAETVNASGTGTFNSKDVLAANLVTVNAVTLANGAAGGLASNYSLGAGQTATAHITPKALTASAAPANKVYDGGIAATAVMNIAGAGLVGTETVTGSGTGVFNSKDVLGASVVTVQAVTLADGANGGLASNYSLGTGQTGTAHITPKALTASATAPDKVYDGNPVAAPVLSVASGLVGAEALGVSGSGTFNSKDVLAANLVTVNAVALANGANGGIASNYSLAAGQTAVAHVTPKALAATVTASGKVYDGTTNASNVLAIASGLVGAETVSATGSAVFNSKDVLTANQVTVQAAVLANGANGGLASNYSLAPGQVASNVHITAKPLTAIAVAADKVYDGNLGGTAVMSIDAAGLVGSETVFGSGTGLFNSKDVGSATTVLVNAVQLANGANGGLASNYSLGTGQAGAAKITRRPSVTWVGAAGGNWADAVNWEFGAIPDLANVANVIIPAGKSVTFTANVPAVKGAVQLDSIDGAGALVVSSGTLNVANALKIGSYAQSAGEVDASALSAAGNFNQAGGKLAVTGKVDIVQSGGTASLADISAANLAISGSGATQTASGTLLVSDTVTLDTGAGDVLLGNKKNDFGKVVIASAHDVTLSDISGLEVNGTVSGTLKTSSDTLTVGPTKVGGNFIASALGAINQTGALDVTGSTIVDSVGALRLDDKKNALRGRVKVNGGGDVLLASSGGLAIGGDVGGKLVLTASGPVIQTVGDALHVKGSSSIDAGAGPVTLTEADNHFTGPLSVKGGALSVVDKGALALGESSVAGNLSISSGGALTQSGKLNVTGTSAIAAKGQAVTLGDAGNTFGGKMTLGAASATVNAAGPLALDSDVDGALTLGSPDLKLNAANALNLHLNTGAATINAAKAVSIDGSATGPLALNAGGAVTQGAALTAGGTTSISAPGQAITLTNAGNDFGGELSLTGAAVQVTDKNALVLGSGAIGGNLQLNAKGDVTQKGLLNVAGSTAIDTTGAVVLGNEGNDFAGAVSVTAGSVTLKDKNVLTVAKLTASKAELSAGSELQVAPGGIVDAPDIALSLSPTAVKGAIGTPVNKFEVRKGARIVLGANTPAVPTYIGGDGAQVVVGNLASSINYSNEAWSMDARTRVNSSIANILQATQKKADSNAVLIERGLPTDLSVPIPYPHEGAMRTKGPACDADRQRCD
jgi:filamentous hemagglutinin family protein